jgi:hypothetical protein
VNDPVALLIFFAATVVVWAVFLLLIVTIVKGRMGEKLPARVRAANLEHAAQCAAQER